MRIESLGSIIEWEDGYLSITKRLAGRRKATTRRLHASEITTVTMAEGTWAMHGFIQFTVAGTPAAAVRRSGLSAGRPPREDMDSMSFSKKHNGEMAKLRDVVEAARHRVGQVEQQPAPVPSDDLAGQLTQLASLHQSGALSAAEYETAKARLLSR